MIPYLIRRLALIIPTVIFVTIILFIIIRMIPGSMVDIIVAEMAGTQEIDRAQVEEFLGLNLPVHEQFAKWAGDIFLHGNLGNSLRASRSVNTELAQRLPITLELALIAIIAANLIALPIGIYSAIRQDTPLDYAGRTFAVLTMSAPAFWLATIIIVYGSIYLNWSPEIQYIRFSQDPLGNLKMMILPGLLAGSHLVGGMMRYARTLMLEVIRQDYIRTAWSKGLRERIIVLRHGLKNAMIPLITILTPELGAIIGGSVIIEQIFNIPGMGRYILESISKREYMEVSGISLVFAMFTLVLILLTDISYAYLDPRVRYR